MNNDLEKTMDKVWEVIKRAPDPEYIVIDGKVHKAVTKTSKFWFNVMNPDIYQVFPALKRKE